MAKYSFLTKKLFIKVSMMRHSPLNLFLQGKSLCFSTRQQVAKCSLSEGPRWKNDISGFIWHKLFIQTVKCSYFNQMIVYQSFYGALLSLNYFFFKGKFVLCHTSASRLQDVYRLKRSEDLVDNTAYIWHKPFIQTVKCSSFNQRIVHQISMASCSC